MNKAIAQTGNVVPIASPTPMDLLQSAIDKGLDPDKLEKLMDLQERWEGNQARKSFAAALAQFQAGCPVIEKKSTANRGNAGSYNYANFETIMAAVRGPLAEAGLSVRFDTETDKTVNVITAICHLTHRDGHTESTKFAAPVDGNLRANDTQKMGSANSYAKRYALLNALNLATGEHDDDGAAAGTQIISQEQAVALRDRIEAAGRSEAKFCEYFGIGAVEDLPASRYAEADASLRQAERRK